MRGSSLQVGLQTSPQPVCFSISGWLPLLKGLSGPESGGRRPPPSGLVAQGGIWGCHPEEGGEMMGTRSRVVMFGGCLTLSVSALEKLCFWHWRALTCQKGEADLLHVAFMEASPIPFLFPHGERELEATGSRPRGRPGRLPCTQGDRQVHVQKPWGCTPTSPPFYR